MKKILALLTGLLLLSPLMVSGVLLATLTAADADETPNCATHNEWDNVEPFMRTWRVEEIIGNNGWFIDTANPDTFARGYNLCWTDNNFGKVWYDGPSGMAIRKDVINPNGQRVGTGFNVMSLFRSAPTLLDAGKPGRWDNTCWGKRVTIRGSFTHDTIQGTDGRDVIFAYAGNDVVNGFGGNDRICGRWGNDILLSGDAGYDRINGGGDQDLVCLGEVTRYC